MSFWTTILNIFMYTIKLHNTGLSDNHIYRIFRFYGNFDDIKWDS